MSRDRGSTTCSTIYQLLTGDNREQIETYFEGKNYKVLKEDLAEVVIESLRPLQEKYASLTGDNNYLDQIPQPRGRAG
jgi:tryptophanyl-tRNA synthetase